MIFAFGLRRSFQKATIGHTVRKMPVKAEKPEVYHEFHFPLGQGRQTTGRNTPAAKYTKLITTLPEKHFVSG